MVNFGFKKLLVILKKIKKKMKSLQNHIQESLVTEGTNAKLSEKSATNLLNDFIEAVVFNLQKDDKEGIKLAKSVNKDIMNDDFEEISLNLYDKMDLYIKFYEDGRMNHPHSTKQIDSINKATYDWCINY